MRFDPSDPVNELYSRSTVFRAFVSSKMAGGAFQAERAVTIDAIDASPYWRAWAFERDADGGPYCSEEECVRYAGTSDALILILGDDLTPVTRSEYEAAYAAGAPTFVMLQAGVARAPELDSFVAVARERGVTRSFSSPEMLATHVAAALRTWTLRCGRAALLRAREERGGVRGADDPSAALERRVVGADERGHAVTVADVVAAARSAAADGTADEALAILWGLAEETREAGLGAVSLYVSGLVPEIIPPTYLDDVTVGWLCNLRGLALSAVGRHGEATVEFDRMRQAGRALADADLESTALQNLGVQDVIAGRNDEARAKFKRSVELKTESGDYFGGLQVMSNMTNVLIAQSRLEEAETLLDDLDELAAGLRIRDPGFRNTLYGHRGGLAVARRDFDAAGIHFRKALTAARRSGSVSRQITTLQNLGATEADLGRPKHAARWFAKALELAEGIEDPSQRRLQRQGLALALLRAGEPTRAAALFEQASNEAAEQGDSQAAAVALGDAGASRLEAGDVADAVSLIQEALAAQASMDDAWRAGQLRNLAAALERDEHPVAAVDRLLEAANLEPLPAQRTDCLALAAEVALRHPATATRAVELFDLELSERKRHESGDLWGWRAAEIGAQLSNSHLRHAALRFFSTALRVFAARGDQRQSYFIRNDRALTYAALGDLLSARRDLQSCLAIAIRLEDAALRHQALGNLGEIDRRRGDLTAATTAGRDSLALARSMKDPEAESRSESLLGLLCADQADYAAAATHFRVARRLARSIGDQSMEGDVLKHEAHVAITRQRPGEATRLYLRSARLLANEPSSHLAEALGGVLVSRAHRGALDEEAATQLVTLSESIGWDDDLVDTFLAAMNGLLSAHASETLVKDAAALALVIGVRHFVSLRVGDDNGDGEYPKDAARPLARASLATLTWSASSHDGGEQRLGAVEASVEAIAGRNVSNIVREALDEMSHSLAEPSPGRRRRDVTG